MEKTMETACKFKHALEILDELEEVRQKATENPAEYSTDCAVRLCSAIVADYFGYESRSDWTDKLRTDTDSHYYKRLNGVDGAAFHL